jgi:hypothetical protein
MWHFTFADVDLQIRPRKGVACKSCWNRRCSPLFLSDRRAASCHCAAARVRGRVVDFVLWFELLGDTIVRRLGVQSALRRLNGGDFVFQMRHYDGACRLSYMGDCRKYLLLSRWTAFTAGRSQAHDLRPLRLYLERLITRKASIFTS